MFNFNYKWNFISFNAFILNIVQIIILFLKIIYFDVILISNQSISSFLRVNLKKKFLILLI